MTAISSDPAQAPQAIVAYTVAQDRRDVAAALAQFAAEARVIDDGITYDGLEGVETFLRTAGSQYTYTRTLLSADEVAPDRWLVVNRLDGNFPGGQVDLRYEFLLADGLISQLTIAP